MSLRLTLVTLVVPDYDDAIDFYVGKLGFELLGDSDLGDGKRWVRVAPKGGGTALLLAKAATPEQQAAIGHQTGGRVGFFLETDNFAETYAHFLGKAVHFLEQPRHEPYGIVAVFADPFGNRWDLVELRG